MTEKPKRKKARWFKCIGLREKKVHNWAHCFKIGEKYQLIKICETTGSLKLIGLHNFYNKKTPRYIDADQFEEVK